MKCAKCTLSTAFINILVLVGVNTLYSKSYIVKGESKYVNEVWSLLSSSDTSVETLTHTKSHPKLFIIIHNYSPLYIDRNL